MSPFFTRALLLVATVLVTTTAEESRFNQVKQSKFIATNEVSYMPPMMILGKSDGSIVRCPVAMPKVCEEFHIGESSVIATAVHGEFLYAALASGDVLRCVWQRPHSCSVFYRTGSMTVGLAVAVGFLHVALLKGTIVRCELAMPHSCHEFATLDRQISSLTAAGSVLYIGSASGQSDTCSATLENSCSLFCTNSAATAVVGISVVGDKIFLVRVGGYIQIGVIATKYCDGFPISGSEYSSIAVYNRTLYLIQHHGEIRVYDPFTQNVGSSFMTVPLYAQHEGTISISFSYGTHAIQDMYRTESEKCIWKGVKCPPAVFHYEVQDRLVLEVFVKNESLYNSQGELIDTRDAHEIHSQKGAIFVMGPDGQILLSNYHRTGLLHTSSLLAGNPVSGAGLMVVHQGKIKNMTACSVHYRPDQELNEQVKDALYLKGYTDPIDSHDCYYSGILCGQMSIADNVV